MGFFKYYYKGVIVALSAFAAGTVISWNIIGGTLPPPNITFPHSVKSANATITIQTHFIYCWIMRLNYMGALVGTFPAGFSAHMFGRRNTIIVLSLVFILSWVLKVVADLNMLLTAQTIGGIAIGFTSVVTPIYLSERADNKHRGTTVSLYFTMSVLGILFMSSLQIASYIWYTCAPLLIPCIFIITTCAAPESPAYLFYCQKREEAKIAISYLRDTSDEQEMEELETEMKELSQRGRPVKDLFVSPAPRRAFIISFFLMILVGLCGSTQVESIIVDFFSVKLYYLIKIINLAVQVISSIVAGRLSDVIGRKALLLASAVIMSASLAILGLYYKLEHSLGSQILPKICVFAYVVGFSSGFGPVPWIIIAELFPMNVKWTGCSLVVFTYWAVELFFQDIYGEVLHRVIGKPIYMWTESGICALSVLFIIFCVPETNGKSCTEIRRILIERRLHHKRRRKV